MRIESRQAPPLQGVLHASWVEVDLEAIRRNLARIRSLVEPARILAVVKSEAYGHGLVPTARLAVQEGVWGLGVATVEEGLALRAAGLGQPVLVLGPVLPAQMDAAIEAGLALVVFDLPLAVELSRRALARGRRVPVHVKVDTGLGRLSVATDQAACFVQELRTLPGLDLEGIYSHLADAEGLDQSYTLLQYRRFRDCTEALERQGLCPPLRHLAGSAAAMLLAPTRLDLVRLGIAMYGLWPAAETRLLMLARDKDLHDILADQMENGAGTDALEGFLVPALTWKTVVVQVKEVPAGSFVGYGCTFETRRPTRIAVLPLGYYEGYDRRLSNCAEVLIRGQRAPVVGRVCMNLTMVDVTDVPGASPGDEVVLLGQQGSARISAEEMAARVGTINYEVVTRIPRHIPRLYRP
jgi:alanine racemase